MAGVALLAKAVGFKVSGCDLSGSSYYTSGLKKEGIKPKIGHNAKHLKGVDILTVSPAVLDLNPDHPEVVEGKKHKILMTWQDFMGQYLQKGKFVIAIAGTHGKSTTTALTGLALEAAGLDPTVEVGAIVKSWGKTVRLGSSRFFVCEADEFNYNFLNYSPSLLIINNIEMDHPEFFKDFGQFQRAFEKLVKKMVGPKILVVNEDDPGVRKLLEKMKDFLLRQKYQVIGYRLGAGSPFPYENRFQARITRLGEQFTEFAVSFGQDSQKAKIEEKFRLKISGIHNVANALGVIAASYSLKANLEKVKKALLFFEGLGRRLEEIGRIRGVLVLDDYGHHPTAIEATIRAAKQKYPKHRIWAIFEPHQFGRIKLFKKQFASALRLADRIVVTKIFEGRERPIKGITGKSLVEEINLPKARHIKDFEEVAETVASEAKEGDVVLVMGAGRSYELSRKILEALKNE